MGCDIHGTYEKKVGDHWVMIKRAEDEPIRDRNYKRFALLAGVRSYEEAEENSPKGLPEDVTESTKLYVDEWGCDGHSHSWMDVKEVADICLKTSHNISEYESKHPIEVFFDLEHYENDEVRFVFWFDN